MSEVYECPRVGCDTVIGVVGEPAPDDLWDDYDPIAEHVAFHERDDELNALPDVAGLAPGLLLDVDEAGRFVIATVCPPGATLPATLPAEQRRASSYAGLQSLIAA